ncbi:cupin domain-containing protein [Bacteriovoracaceae bacterium]|nr:cupin domain-containing protein [Bacteriovoracaceae bacterium]
MSHHIKHFDFNKFKTDHWNKKEYFVNNAHDLQLKQYLPDFQELWNNPLIEKRVISQEGDQFSYKISSFLECLPPSIPTTVFVQNIDHYSPNLKCIYQLLSFIPKYRIEDIMLSFSNEQGSSGPHVDFYDVFILQVSGSKSWKVEKNLRSYNECDEDHLQKNSEIKLLKDFSSDHITYNLHPGDLLYVPSHLAHWATNHEDTNSISLSVGLRSPKIKDFIYSAAHELAECFSEDHRLTHSLFNNQDSFELKIDNLNLFNLPFTLPEEKKSLQLIQLGKLFTENPYWELNETNENQDITLDPQNIKLKSSTRFCYFINQNQYFYFFNGEVFQTSLNLIDQLVLYFNQQNNSITLNPDHEEEEGFIQFIIDNDIIELT